MSRLPAPVVMVHGAFCGGWVFDRFRLPFEAAGHAVTAVDLRGHEPGVRPETVVGLSMTDYARDVAAVCAALPEPPILVGHSLGGLVAQMAAARAPVRGLALLAPSPPWGVAGSSVEEAVTAFGLHMLGAFWTQAVSPDPDLMRGYSLNRLPSVEREQIVAQMGVESGRALWETLNWWLDPFMTTSISAGALKAPVLAMAGERDVVHPPATVRQTAARLGARYEELPEMSHWLLAEPGWEGCANAILRWMTDEVRLSA